MINLKSISWDLETYSSVDLTKCGVYRYCESEDFEILLAAYSIDGGAVQVTDLACGEKLPQEILDVLEDETVEKWSYNSQFERIVSHGSSAIRPVTILLRNPGAALWCGPQHWAFHVPWKAWA